MALFSFNRNYDPINALLALQNDLERSFDSASGFHTGLSGRGTYPPANVFKGEAGYVITLEAPGCGPEDFNIESLGQTVKISGKRERSIPVTETSAHRNECWQGEFTRSIQLPNDADLSCTLARAKNGILRLEVPFREETRPKLIEVSTE